MVQIPLDALKDSRIAFNFMSNKSGMAEKRLQIDIVTLPESHLRGKRLNLSWIPASENPNNGRTKDETPPETQLLQVSMKTNKLECQVTGWAEVNLEPGNSQNENH